jgi:predicted RNase H-like HicB family nuclease
VAEVPYTIERDENGMWCASAQLGPKAFAYGDGESEEAALADLRAGIELYLLDSLRELL